MKKTMVIGCLCAGMVLAACKGKSIHNAAATDTSGKVIQNPNDSTGGNIINKDSTSTNPGDGTPANNSTDKEKKH
jgi:protein involved in sex pheromone biosynthesis